MNIQSEKSKIIRWIESLSDKDTIERIKIVKESHNTDWWTELSDFEKKSIDRGIDDIKHGKLHKHSDVKKIYAKWL